MSERERRFVERVWFGRDGLAETVRALLLPAERVFGGIVGVRDILYDAGWLSTREPVLPAVSIGNLTVGGTGKTPIAAWVVHGLVARGASPAVILRGYGDDEPLVHKTLNPAVPVVVNPDRVDGISEAKRLGANIAVLDDAFQHRRARRVADLVLISADRWTDEVRLLPAGPWREPLRAIRRASLVIVTRKAASQIEVDAVHTALAAIAPSVPRVSVYLAPGELVRLPGAVPDARSDGHEQRGAGSAGSAAAPSMTQPMAAIRGKRVHAITAIGDPEAFVRQLEAAGAEVESSPFTDHHAFTKTEIDTLVGRGEKWGAEWIVCTLKDAVKLGPRWPRLAPPLWYVSQQVLVERGVGGLEHLLDDLARMR